MASNSDIKQHISVAERAKWNQVWSAYFDVHRGSGGIENHRLADGTTPGFSTHDFTTELREKLIGIEVGALNNPHPDTHPYTMITGLAEIAHTGSWNDLKDIPTRVREVINGTYDAATVGGVRITIGTTAPSNPKNNQEIWIDTTVPVLKVYTTNRWETIGAAFR